MRWKYRNNQNEKINVDESGMTQFDPLFKWEVGYMRRTCPKNSKQNIM